MKYALCLKCDSVRRLVSKCNQLQIYCNRNRIVLFRTPSMMFSSFALHKWTIQRAVQHGEYSIPAFRLVQIEFIFCNGTFTSQDSIFHSAGVWQLERNARLHPRSEIYIPSAHWRYTIYPVLFSGVFGTRLVPSAESSARIHRQNRNGTNSRYVSCHTRHKYQNKG